MTEYDSELENMESSLQEIDALVNDFNRELSSYMEDLTFDDESFYETEQRLDLINGLKSKYGQSIEEIQLYLKKQQEKLENLIRYEERFQEAEEHLAETEKILETASYDLSEIRKEYSQQH